MEEILSQISNPYDMENFKRLINLYLRSRDNQDFYSKVVTYYQDKDMTEREQEDVHMPSTLATDEIIGHWKKIEYYSNFFSGDSRIYINSPVSATKSIVNRFMHECVSQSIPFLLKYSEEENERNDGIVIVANSEVYKNQIEILRKIAVENPELVQQCGTPHLLVAKLDGWLGLSDENISNRFVSYTQSRLETIDLAFNRFMTKHDEIRRNVLSITKNEKLLNELYSIFQEECEKQNIDPQHPAFAKGTIEQLIKKDEVDMEKPDIITEDKSYIELINEYFSDPEKQLTVQEQVKLRSAIDRKSFDEVELTEFMLQELRFLNEHKLMDSSVGIQTAALKDLESRIVKCTGYKDRFYRFDRLKTLPGARKMIAVEGNEIAKDKARKIIDERIRQMQEFFKQPLDDKEQLKKCIENLDRIDESFTGPYFNGDLISLLDSRIQLLQFQLDHYEELKEVYARILEGLDGISYTDEQLSTVIEECQPKHIKSDIFEDEEEIEYVPKIEEEGIEEYDRLLKSYIGQKEKTNRRKLEETLAMRERNLTSLEAEEEKISKAEALIDRQARKESSDKGEKIV